MNTLTVIIADTQFGGTTAVAPPEFENSEGQLISASKQQGWLYECWNEFREYSYSLLKRHRARLVFIHMGDIIEGDHHQSVQLLPSVEDQENLATQMLEPYALKADRFFIVRGTEAHSGPNGESENRIASRLGATIMWEGLLNIDGVVVDIAHHGRAGKRPWTSAAAGMALEAKYNAITEGNPIPRYVFRGHNHVVDDSGEKVDGTRALVLPCWQLKTAFGNKVAAGSRSDIGGLIILPDGSLDTSRLRYRAMLGQREIQNV